MAIAPSGVSRPSELAHLVLRTNNAKRLVDFYTKFLNARVVHGSELITFLTWDHEHHRLAILHDATATPRPENSCGMDHFALTFDSLGALLTSYRARKEMGFEPAYCVHHGMSTSMYYRDPDGNKIETQVDAYEKPEDAVAFMMSAEFAKDPRGPRFDPDEMLRRFEAGEDEKTLMVRGAVPPVSEVQATA
ncbi:biphenyl-2,3-diol 1,2-dioxygenase 2 [Colletotrichum kahawae]|uniref:Biphenyl-2,3-diol 1,2-dioxygenase 2 n=1 Tax=Colletotrichum kahawae TaxID=34407 RepID=A0AAD9YDG8_COLKA|nr:biphenyl-2, 3-diol 1, 2-dioxygenase 2 [Colletotrichum camelliae]KAK2756637.1 biphenyl-2,3-diol 1,2-dioxygenase 2 [Colletotrichum kahawae]